MDVAFKQGKFPRILSGTLSSRATFTLQEWMMIISSKFSFKLIDLLFKKNLLEDKIREFALNIDELSSHKKRRQLLVT